MSNQVNKLVQEVFLDLSNALTTGSIETRMKIGLSIDGSEHGSAVMLEAAEYVKKSNLFDLVLIGSKIETDCELIETCGEFEAHEKMEELLDSNYIQGCVTLHYNFPIGVATVGKVITPAFGKEMYIATTTGTTSSNRNEAMLLNTINGIIAAKSNGIAEPTIGILNIDGARSVERALQELNTNGYKINFASSKRSDGGVIMRGNDLLMASVDVMVCDSLTGNILMKMFSAFNTGGSYEATGFGYGPGVGKNYSRNICIISRASGSLVIANALTYAYELAKGNIAKVTNDEYEKASKAKLADICAQLQPKQESATTIKMPDKEIVTKQINGIDVTELDDAVACLAEFGIYAESGMGCTGPIILVNTKNLEQSMVELKNSKFI